jgi:uncharacterized protein with PIN domain
MPRYRFYGELNELLPRSLRGRSFEQASAENATIKHAIEALGVPHTEVARVRVNGVWADFSAGLSDSDVVEVYPGAPGSISASPAFLADAHLGGLARRLRLLGFDTVLASNAPDRELAALADDEGRIVLSRDRELLKHRRLSRGRYVRAQRTDEQLSEVLAHFALGDSLRPFSRCLECNGELQPASREEVIDRLPPAVAASQSGFKRCRACGRVYWPGSHWQRLNEFVESVRTGPFAGGPTG